MNKHITSAELIDMLREENRQLKAQIKKLTGQDMLMHAMRTFKLSVQQGRLFCMLLQCGECEKSDLLDACWSPSTMLDTDEGLRSAIKLMRRKLEKIGGIEIEVVYGIGYAMSDASRRRARKLLEAA